MSIMVDIRKRLGRFQLDVKFDSPDKSLGLLGASGCGKSMTLKCIAGIETPDHGRIVLNDRVLFDSELGINLPVQERNVGMLFQNYALFPHMTVKKNIEFGLGNRRDKNHLVETLVGICRLEGMLHKYPEQLSGGEQQRVALARSMSLEPELLMLDEPFHALDAFLKETLQLELLEVLAEYRGKIIMVSHSRDELYRFCERISVIYHGHVIESAGREDIFGNTRELATARLTGCKNISRAEKVNDHVVRALDWNLCLNTNRIVQDTVSHVGIRAHDIQSGEAASVPEDCIRDGGHIMTENRIPVTLAETSEGPYECSLILQIEGSTGENNKLWWIIPNKEWKKIDREHLPRLVLIPGEDILLLEDHS